MTSGLSDIGVATAHPLLRAVADLESRLDDAADAPAWTLSRQELRDALPRLTRAKARLAELELRVLVEADRQSIGDELGFTNTALWWAHETGQTKPSAWSALRLARDLDSRHGAVRAALATGDVMPDQARVIVDAIEALPTDLVDPTVIASAERHLLGLAAHHDAKALRILGRKVLDVLAPEIGEEHERRLLEAEEHHAAATATFTMRPDGSGSMVGRFKIPILHGEMLAKHLYAIAAPKHRAAVGASDAASAETVSRPLRLGRAFAEYVETRTESATPKAGGIAATMVVTMSLTSLVGGDAAATLDTGERISASEARRLACEAGIIPAVLGSRSQVLDLGRKTRFHTEPQRVALAQRDGGCAAEHCDWPPGMCHAHHPRPWSKGGGTSVENGLLLCPRHHTLAHDARYQLKAAKNGRVAFSRRT